MILSSLLIRKGDIPLVSIVNPSMVNYYSLILMTVTSPVVVTLIIQLKMIKSFVKFEVAAILLPISDLVSQGIRLVCHLQVVFPRNIFVRLCWGLSIWQYPASGISGGILEFLDSSAWNEEYLSISSSTLSLKWEMSGSYAVFSLGKEAISMP